MVASLVSIVRLRSAQNYANTLSRLERPSFREGEPSTTHLSFSEDMDVYRYAGRNGFADASHKAKLRNCKIQWTSTPQ